jgi:tripartite-type tricarboxylate transporter receptor subunit TctC
MCARVLGVLMLLAAAPGTTAAQTFPNRPVQIIIPFAAGGSIDITFRIVAPALAEQVGQPVLIVNKPGAGATIGMNAVATAAPDGHTLGAASHAFAANPTFMAGKMPFNPEKDLVPVTMVARSAMVVLVHPAVPARTMPELIAYAKANPGKINYGSVGIASSGHVFTALLESIADVRMTHVPYNTGPLPGLAAGDIQLQFSPIPSALGFIKSGKVVPIAVTSLEPDPALPGVPTVAQTLPGFDVFEWPALVAPAGTPAPVIWRIHQEVVRALAKAEVRAKLEAAGSTPVGSSPEEFGEFLKRQMALWAKVAGEIKEREVAGR